MDRGPFILAMAIACAACGKSQTSHREDAAQPNVIPEASPREIPVSLEPGAFPDGPAPLAEGPVDPKSAQGAGQVLQQFAALLEQQRFGEASTLGEEDFTGIFPKDSVVHSEIGAPGAIEGAAGSLYVQIPIRFYGRLSSGKDVSQRAIATLRRVNDVPGSTEEQRQWRIYRLDMQPPP